LQLVAKFADKAPAGIGLGADEAHELGRMDLSAARTARNWSSHDGGVRGYPNLEDPG
jgi:hypothetical protein